MTNEDYIIEILMKAEKLGLREKVLNETNKMMKENPKLSLSEVYDLSFEKITEHV